MDELVEAAGACGARPVFDRVRRGRSVVRLAAVLAVVVLPLFLFGLGMTVWTIRQGLPWDIAVAAQMGVGITAAVYLRRQPGANFAGQLAMWSAATFASSKMGAHSNWLGATSLCRVLTGIPSR